MNNKSLIIRKILISKLGLDSLNYKFEKIKKINNTCILIENKNILLVYFRLNYIEL